MEKCKYLIRFYRFQAVTDFFSGRLTATIRRKTSKTVRALSLLEAIRAVHKQERKRGNLRPWMIAAYVHTPQGWKTLSYRPKR